MKKNIVKTLMYLSVCLLMVTGCGDKKDHFEEAKKKMQELKSYSMEFSLIVGVDYNDIDMEIPVKLVSDVDVQNKKTKMTTSMKFMGKGTETISYIDATDESNIIQYTSTDDSNWEISTSSNENQINNLVQASDLKQLEDEDDFYVYEAVINSEDVKEIINQTESESVTNDMDLTDNVTFKYFINKKSGYVEKITADLKDSIQISTDDDNVSIKKLNFEIIFSKFNEIDEITIPEVVQNNDEEKTMICSSNTSSNGMEINLKYTVDYIGNYVTNVSSEEKITSSNESLLETYKTQIENMYSIYKDIEYYNYKVQIDGNTLISTTDINYNKIDTDKMIEIDSNNSSLIKNGKININDIENLYNQVGASCTK